MIISVKTGTRTELVDITSKVRDAIRSLGVEDGICMVYVPHTTAAVTINESADPSVRSDIIDALNKMVPENLPYKHLEGNSPAHVKSSLIGASEIIAVEHSKLVLGTWQGVFFCEFDGPRNRKVHIRMMSAGL